MSWYSKTSEKKKIEIPFCIQGVRNNLLTYTIWNECEIKHIKLWETHETHDYNHNSKNLAHAF